MMSLGYATTFGDIYLGTWYNGNIMEFNKTEEVEVRTDYNLTTQLPTQTRVTTEYDGHSTYTNNRINALVGILGMGIKLGFHQEMRTWANDDVTIRVTENFGNDRVTTETYNGNVISDTGIIDEFVRNYGTMTPSLAFGMSLEVGDLLIRPQLNASLVMGRDNRTIVTSQNPSGSESFVTVGGEAIAATTGEYWNGYSGNYIRPMVTAGADVTLTNRMRFGIFYGIDMMLHKNDYKASGIDGDVKGTARWNGNTTVAESIDSTITTTSKTVDVTEMKSMYHKVTPTFSWGNEVSEGLQLGVAFSVPIGFGGNSSESYRETYSSTVTEFKHKDNEIFNNTVNSVATGPIDNNDASIKSRTEFNVIPNIRLGATYAWVPGKFNINTGASFTPVSFQREIFKESQATRRTSTETTTLNAKGEVVSETKSIGGTSTDRVVDSVLVNTKWAPYAGASGGFTLFFNNNMAVDMAVASGYDMGMFAFDLAEVRVLFSVKF